MNPLNERCRKYAMLVTWGYVEASDAEPARDKIDAEYEYWLKEIAPMIDPYYHEEF